MDEYIQDRLFIGGEWVAPIDGEVIESVNPASGENWARAAFAGPRDVEAAVAAANEALTGPWSTWSVAQRAALLRQIGAMFEDKAEYLARLETMDNGMLFTDNVKNMHFQAQCWYYFAGLVDKLEGRTIPVENDLFAFTSRVPVGVVAAILPWNAPLQMITWKLAPALAAGCTMVIKSAEHTPVTAYEFARFLETTNLPRGVVNIVSGTGPKVGQILAAHPDVHKISFTGEHRTAQLIMREAAVNLKKLSFECGGKSPHIIFDDANLEQAINAATHSSFALCGQSCALGSRLMVHKSVYARVASEVAARAGRVRVGDPLDAATQMGPQAHREQYEKTLRYFEIGQSEGATLLAGGEKAAVEGRDGGFFIRPTVFGDVANEMRIAREEIFGPVVSIIPFETDDEVVAMANDTEYGLVAGVWTQDISRAHRVAARIQAGTVWINTYRVLRPSIPYGGFKMSGIGRENGMEAIDAYLQTRATVVNLAGTYPNILE